jgi:pilus assembly protein CpaB
MNWKTWAPAAGAVILGGIAAKVAKDSMNKARTSSANVPKMVQVVVAKGILAPGQEITADQLTLVPIASPTAPPETFTKVDDVVGHVLTTPLMNGQTVMGGFLAPKGTMPGLPSLVPPGMRAITIDVSESSGLAGLLLPGAHVDVVSTVPGTDAQNTKARTIVQNAIVQAVGQRLTTAKPEDGKEPPMFHTVTMIVKPHEAEMIELANLTGRMRLVLRGAGDQEPVDPSGISLVELRDPNKKPDDTTSQPPIQQVKATEPTEESEDDSFLPMNKDPRQEFASAKPAAAKRPVVVIRGGKQSTEEVDAPTQDAGGKDMMQEVAPDSNPLGPQSSTQERESDEQ